MTRVCAACGVEKHLTEFYRQDDCEGGRVRRCRGCMKAGRKAREPVRAATGHKPRPCVVCGKEFTPSHLRNPPARACSPKCSAALGAQTMGGRKGKTGGSRAMRLDPLDEIPCTRCGLRGHVAGDPDRCIGRVETYGHAEGGAADLRVKRGAR